MTTSISVSDSGVGGRRAIQRLPDSLINKIAAGEVVERPASVVKELLENAIDAGATRLALAVEDGGRTLIRITDNGHGIPAEEIPLAFMQHATSKISSTEDLFAIATMGFRGEALASIASVSHAVLTTRTAEASTAYRVEINDARVSEVVPAAGQVGTTLEVRDLFYSVPARRKFLRTDATEFSHIHEMVLRSALPNAGVAFSLTHNGKKVLELPVTGDHRLRVATALMGEEAGKGLYADLLPVRFDERGIRVTGFAGQPHLARATAKYQYLFLNGRYVRDRGLLHALKEAYRGLTEPASQPVGILFIEMDPTSFDVNVHPQKTEVRFRDSGGPYRAVLAAVRETLLATDLTPQVKTAGRTDGSGQWSVEGGQTTRLSEVGGSRPEESSSLISRADRFTPAGALARENFSESMPGSETRQLLADFFKAAPATVQPSLPLPMVTRDPSPLHDPSRVTFVSPPPTEQAAGPLQQQKFVQLHDTYLVSEIFNADGSAGGLVIIDQHALHERILYEELFARATRGVLEGQRLLIPEILPITPRHAAALETVKPLLLTMGIELTEFDAGSVAVHSFPSLLSKVNPREFLRDLLDRLLEIGKLTSEELLHEVLDMASCKAAVKAGYPLSQEEIAALLARKEQVDRSSNCPHGRPTTLKLSLSDLERQFKRK